MVKRRKKNVEIGEIMIPRIIRFKDISRGVRKIVTRSILKRLKL